MRSVKDFEFDDLQGLVRCGHGELEETCFLLLNITEVKAARLWIQSAPFTNATSYQHECALQIAFSVEGLRTLELNELYIDGFSDEFITGMSGDESRSRRLGDIANNSPELWDWGGDIKKIPHIILMMYGRGNNFASWKQEVQGEHFSNAFQIISELPTSNILDKEPFGFSDGISQPKIDWDNQQSTEIHTRDRYSNLLAKGEVVLGYKNEYGYYTDRPLINVGVDPQACILPDAEDKPGLKDLGRNGSYLICRQLSQDVQGFWRFMQEQAGDNREQLAAAMVGRQLDDKGTPLITELGQNIPGIENKDNNFNYDQDPVGNQCPISAHIRRSNPRTGDLSAGPPGLISRLKRKLGFGLKPEDDLVTSTRYHRLLRRGRAYGTMLSPEQAIVSKEKNADRGLQFICLAGNISRQFEFVQNAWNDNSKFSGLQQQSDPILGNRHKLLDGEASNQFHQPQAAGPQHKTCQLPQFVTVRGGGYFFMPGLRALQYLTTLTDVPE